jgi:hypothetical protein
MKGASTMNRAIAYLSFTLGMLLIIISVFNEESSIALIGLGLTFWGGLLLYITPSKYVPLEVLNATATSTLTNIESIITDSNLYGKGIYLPQKYLKDFETSLVFIPSRANQYLPEPMGILEEKLYSRNPNGILLTPPGLALSKLFERKLGITFTRTDLNYLQENLPKLLIEELEIAETTDIKTEKNTVTIAITNHIFKEICQETRKLQRIHESIGCILCSGIACALAKATGKPVIIEKEEQSQDGKTTKIQYRILED